MAGVWHPTNKIRGSKGWWLGGTCLLIGVTGSVAAYKALDTARWLVRRGAKVRFVASKAALELLGEKLLHWATGEPPITGLSGEVEHIAAAEECDAMLVAPVTLASLAKISLGVTDTPVTLTAVSILGMGKPLVLAPAMHGNMLSSPQYREAVERLGKHAVIVPPRLEEGVAKYPDPELLARVLASVSLRGRDLEGRRVVVTAGATREWLDPVRFISNPSSGRMGYEVAVAAWARGARVVLVHGNMTVKPPHMVEAVRAETTSDMKREVSKALEEPADALIASAAPVDFAPEKVEAGKIRSGGELVLKLKPTPKVIEGVSDRVKVLAAFAAETAESREELVRSGLEKMEKYGASLVVANNVGRPGAGFEAESLDAVMVWRSRGKLYVEDLGRMRKEVIAHRILDTIGILLSGG
ncbi:MAG: bifunctional phosphopantothenoylcysteine decarboxylase/phosphopantothenate--cysteine ligase CoaBC [Desulfurococcales archaeon]|nr:bifunctional phosphopantothenoylcysteine decarboxylase/phosphopantothenate--cysteine ligase CoaBC [Desulfurococcales archaeon]